MNKGQIFLRISAVVNSKSLGECRLPLGEKQSTPKVLDMQAIGEVTGHTGQTCQVSGVYRCVNCKNPGGSYEIPLSKGETFPPCRKCNAAVTWRLVRRA